MVKSIKSIRLTWNRQYGKSYCSVSYEEVKFLNQVEEAI